MTEIKPTQESKTEKNEIKTELNISLEKNSRIFQRVISSINEIMEDSVTLKLTPSDLTIRCLDKSRFVMVDLKVNSSFFDKFNVNKEIFMTIPILRLKDILNCHRKNDIINISFDNYDQLLLITLTNDISREYTIPLRKEDETYLPSDPTSLEFDCNISFNNKQLTNISDDLKSIKSGFTIKANQNELIFSNYKDKSKNKITIPKEHLKEIQVEGEISSSYNQDTFKSVIPLDSLFLSNNIRFSADKPLLLQFSMDDLSINYLIAPEQPEEPEESEELEFEEKDEDSDDWEDEKEESEEEESEEEKPEEVESEKVESEKEYPNLSECSMSEIEILANTDLKMLKIEANKQLNLEIKKQAHKKTVIDSIKNILFPEE